MRNASRHLALFVLSSCVQLFCVFSSAQEPSDASLTSLTVVNAVPGENNVFVSFDGESIWPPGFTSGQSTAAVMFPSGKPMVKVECEGYASAEAKLDLPPGANCAIIFYPGEVVPEGPDKGKRRVGVFVAPPHLSGAKAVQGNRWKAILVGSSASAEVEFSGKRLLLSPRQAVDIAATDGILTVSYRGREILGSAPEDAGEYWVVIFPAEDDLRAVMLNHSPFKISSD